MDNIILLYIDLRTSFLKITRAPYFIRILQLIDPEITLIERERERESNFVNK